MGSYIRDLCGKLFAVEPQERLKVLFLTIAFFFIISAYTIAKDLKDVIFMSIVGKEYVPWAKVLSILVLIPSILLYSKLVDKIRRYQLLVVYTVFFGLVGLLFAFFIGDPNIGIANTHTGPERIFGWLFYFFVEGYSPFVVSVLWAFANSITSPDAAKKNYGLMVSGSKVGGMLSAGLAWVLFSSQIPDGYNAMTVDIFKHQIVLVIASMMLLVVPIIVILLMRLVPGHYLHGYEAVYQAEKSKEKKRQPGAGILGGLTLLIKHPYVLGIFGMVFFYEMIGTVLSYLRLGIAQSNAATISNVSSFLYQMRFMMHTVGLLISLFGTRTLLKTLGERRCLLLIPILSGILLLYFMIATTPQALILAFVVLQSVNYAFSWPVRESLYIPTVKEIKFKSKSWIDAFGSKFGKTTGSTFNIIASRMGAALLPVHSVFFAVVVLLWFMDAFLLGRRFEKAVMNNEVIGLNDEED